MARLTRGQRNCNPCNIRKGEHWQGLREQQTDRLFCQFIDNAHGYRAFFKLIQTYRLKYQLRTVAQIIARYAPSNENATDLYIKQVCDYMHLRKDELLNYNSKYTMIAFAKIVSFIECNYNFPIRDIEQGYNLYMHNHY